MIATKDEINFAVYKHDEEWCTRGPCFNETKFQTLHEPLIDEFLFTEHEDSYDLMCGLYYYENIKERSTGAMDFYGGQPLPINSNVITPIFSCVTIYFINAWINTLDRNSV